MCTVLIKVDYYKDRYLGSSVTNVVLGITLNRMWDNSSSVALFKFIIIIYTLVLGGGCILVDLCLSFRPSVPSYLCP